MVRDRTQLKLKSERQVTLWGLLLGLWPKSGSKRISVIRSHAKSNDFSWLLKTVDQKTLLGLDVSLTQWIFFQTTETIEELA